MTVRFERDILAMLNAVKTKKNGVTIIEESTSGSAQHYVCSLSIAMPFVRVALVVERAACMIGPHFSLRNI